MKLPIGIYRIVFSLIILVSSSLSAQAQKAFELDDVSKLVNLSDPQISPDGKSIVVVVSRPDFKTNRYNAELVLVDIATARQRVLTFERPTVTQPRWSPAGDQLAFVSRVGQGKEATTQLFVMSMLGGEARQITKVARGVQHYSWNPAGTEIAFVTSDEPANKTEIEKGNDGFEVGNNDMFLSAAPTSSHIWLAGLDGGEPRRLTSGSWSLPVTIPPGAPSSPLTWSPDGKHIAFVKVKSPYSGDGPWRSVHLLSVADGNIKPLTSRQKYESYPTFSPDGTSISYWLTKDERPGDINTIWVAPATGGQGKNITASLDREAYRPIWMPDGKSVILGGHDDNRTSLWIQPVDGAARKLNLGALNPSWSFWIDMNVGKNGGIAFTATDPKTPVELYYMATSTAAPKKLTEFNKEVASLALGKVETIRWDLEGLKHNGILTYPANYNSSKKYPLVLVIHGGPASASIESFSRLAQLLAGRGYFVFEPNYRGSDNLGSKYKTAIINDAGAGPGRDVMAGVALLKKSGMIDTTRVAVSGWSYGGYMTTWLTGHYGGWKAAVAGAAVTDLQDQYNLGDFNVNRAATIGGSPWTGNQQAYVDQSPITNAHKIKAPTLILGNTEDPRVPITQSYKLYHALKDNGVEVKFIAWPLPAHNASDPVRQKERDRYWMGWLDRFLQDGNGNLNATIKSEN